tara:strand:- start:1499 stop:1747 length:249 start_codon:yes stop_codon:yes gene_type:complete
MFELLDVELNKLGEFSEEQVEIIFEETITNETDDTIIDTEGINFYMWNENQEDFIDVMCEGKSEEEIANMRFFKLIPTEEDE